MVAIRAQLSTWVNGIEIVIGQYSETGVGSFKISVILH